MRIGLIISAGNQSRFKDSTPKSLMKIGDKTLLDMNIENMKHYVDHIFVVCSRENKGYFMKYPRIIIDSGKGCGDAVLKALKNFDEEDDFIIEWGDSYHDKKVFSKFKNFSKITVPVREEETPYVQIKESKGVIKKVLFSKYGDKVERGYHDLSIFYGNVGYLRYYLQMFANKITFNGEYQHGHNNELQFLDVFNETDIVGEIQPLNVKDYSFNTVEEFNELSKQLGRLSGN